MSYKFLHVTDQELLDRVHRFRYQIWCEELEYITPNKNKKEMDEYDSYCDQFAILDKEDKICATMRLIHNSPIGYPTEKFLNLDNSVKIYPRERLGEMSRIFVSPEHRSIRKTKIIFTGIIKSLAYMKMKEHGIDYVYGSLEHSFLKLVNMFKIPYIPIDNAGLYNGVNDGSTRYPAILYTKALEFQNPQLLKQWNKLSAIRNLKICRRKPKRNLSGLKPNNMTYQSNI